jgi:hypothetical protein
MAFQRISVPLFISSDPALGAINISNGGDRWDNTFKNSLIFPDTALNITIEAVQASVWWTVRNIKFGINDRFRLNISGDPGSPYDLVVPPGLYSISDLNSAVDRELVNAGLASGITTLTGDLPTGRVLVTLNQALLQVEWVLGSFFALVGFNSGQTVPAVGFSEGVFSELGPNEANFSDVTSFLLHTTPLVQNGIPTGNQENQTLANVPIQVPPGSLQNFSPNNPIRLNANHLRGQIINQVTFFVTDQLNRSIDFGGEFVTLLIEIKYDMPVGQGFPD